MGGGPSRPKGSHDLVQLASFMAGSFGSAEQAAADTSYFDIRLRMVPIWPDQADGVWFYVEQAVASDEDRPYRQRVYHLTQLSATLFESEVFTLDAPLRFAGEWRKEHPLENMRPDSLIARDGCSILLRRKADDLFGGSTLGRDCPSELRGASYATSEVEIRPDRLVSWDRGFDANGKQVWGAEKGGYIFRKVEDWANRLGEARGLRPGAAR